MSYPYDAPATEMSGYWSDGAYTPTETVAYIRDDFTPINKNTMVNSVGKNLSLIQNFVNQRYLGRSGNYIQDGYISALHVNELYGSGYVDPDTSGTIELHSDIRPKYYEGASLGTELQAFSRVVSSTVKLRTLQGAGGLDGDLVVLDNDIVPSGPAFINLGQSDIGFHNIYTSGVTATNVIPDYITASDYSSKNEPGTVYLCASLLPEYYVKVKIGDIDGAHRIRSVCQEYNFLTTDNASWDDVSNDSNIPETGEKENALWVDPSGYVRRGDFPVT